MIEVIILILLAIATVYDLKYREVPDWVTYSFGIVGLMFGKFFFHHLIGLAVFYLIGRGLYDLKLWGGADAKVLAGFGAIYGIFAVELYIFMGLVFIGAVICSILRLKDVPFITVFLISYCLEIFI